jgi:hypothetical protein
MPPLIFQGGHGVQVGLALVYGLMHRVHESFAAALLDVVLSRREKPIVTQLPLDIAAIILALHHQGLPAMVWPPPGEPSRGFLILQGASAWKS